jgi:hypothetical protein
VSAEVDWYAQPSPEGIDTSRPNTSGRMTLHESLELIRERYGDAIRQLGEQ